jgi:hypothetical protein
LLSIGGIAYAARGFHAISFALIVIGGVLLAASVFDFPLSTSFDGDGIVRHTMVRAQRLPWTRVAALARAPASRLKPRSMRKAGPLVATMGKRRYLLVDCTEGPDEYDAIRRFVSTLDDPPLMNAQPPEEGTAPTWLYHRKR